VTAPMNLPKRTRWRIAVLGNSVPILLVPARRNRIEGPYPELLERVLMGRGYDVRVDSHARMHDLAYEGERRWRRAVAPTSPDVLILNYGAADAQHNVLPTRLNRHLTRKDAGGPGLAGMWVRHGVRRVWPLARTYQRWASGKVGEHIWRLHPDRVRACLSEVISSATGAGRLVLVIDVLPPGDRLHHFFPGIDRRIERMNDALRTLVTDADSPDVRLVESSAIATALGPSSVPDGFHLAPEGHRRLAIVLADQIEPWLEARR
jgi:lysophospholipase L1-like esterase